MSIFCALSALLARSWLLNYGQGRGQLASGPQTVVPERAWQRLPRPRRTPMPVAQHLSAQLMSPKVTDAPWLTGSLRGEA